MSDFGGGDDDEGGYEPYDAEPAYDEEEAFEPVDPDDAENPDKHQANGEANGTDDPDAMMVNGDSHQNNIVAIEDPNQAGGRGKKNAVVGLREKKIAEDKRSTTPYMTKYERARVLGTRALQIRYVVLESRVDENMGVGLSFKVSGMGESIRGLNEDLG
ncbi:DNA-directed RNA polymerases I II and III subunit RPABC2 [Xylographa bjoerkii]|nr:DNA-directed RNA polymerases I II and III subunit RPABC2 [Xylographa bjoerkii]